MHYVQRNNSDVPALKPGLELQISSTIYAETVAIYDNMALNYVI